MVDKMEGIRQFNEIRPLNSFQAKSLVKDILTQSVKRFGTYSIGKYRIRISILKHRRIREKTMKQYYTSIYD